MTAVPTARSVSPLRERLSLSRSSRSSRRGFHTKPKPVASAARSNFRARKATKHPNSVHRQGRSADPQAPQRGPQRPDRGRSEVLLEPPAVPLRAEPHRALVLQAHQRTISRALDSNARSTTTSHNSRVGLPVRQARLPHLGLTIHHRLCIATRRATRATRETATSIDATRFTAAGMLLAMCMVARLATACLTACFSDTCLVTR